MMTELFAWAARTSLAALPLALAVLLLARVRFIQPRWRAWIGALLFLRLALPAVPEASWNVWSLNATPATTADVRAGESDRSMLGVPPSGGSFVVPPSGGNTIDWEYALAIVWLAGFVTTLGWLATSHFVTRRWILRNRQPSLRWFDALAEWARERQGVSQRVPVVIVRGLSTMAIFGWLRPRLLIPADLADRYTSEQIRGMLLHEFAHVRRRDVLWTWLALLACALHWFNPLAWLAFRRFCADRELICDAAALDELGEAGRHSYGDALLRSLDVTPLSPAPSLSPFFRIHPEIKHRILMITKPMTPTVWSRLVVALLVPALSLIAFTTSRAQSEGEKPAREGEKPRSESREGERSRSAERDGEKPREGARDGEAKKESELDKYKRENAERKAQRDGESKREDARDGERSREGARAGEGGRSPERDGARPRDGREGDAPRRGDGEMKRGEARDGEARRSGERDGDRPREGARDGESRKAGPRDGEVKKDGPRDGETRKEGARDGERSREGSRDGDGEKRDGDREL